MRSARPALAAALAATIVTACSGGARPNIVLIVIDTARADRFTFNGYAKPTTPRLASLAAEGAIYERAYSPAPWTLPAHASLFTGMYPSSHGADGTHPRLDVARPTLAERLREAGYRTVAYIGNPWVAKSYRFDRGFDKFEEIWRAVDAPDGSGAELIGLNVQRFLDDRRDDVVEREHPFFLFINYLEPHLPYNAPEPERGRFLTPPIDAPRVERLRAFKTPEELRYILGLSDLTAADIRILSDLYDGEIAYCDRRVGEIADMFRRQEMLDDTVFVVTSDHGEAIGEHHMLDHKMSVYDEVLRIPLVVRYPRAIAAGQRIRRPVMLQDLYPTLLYFAGTGAGAGAGAGPVPLPEMAPLPGVRGLEPGPERSVLLGEFSRPPFVQVMRENFPKADLAAWDRALVAWHEGDGKFQWGSDGRHLLFDLAGDPGELHDLAPADAERVKALAARVDAWLARPGARSLTAP
jgi:arylsulfatase A-like enzyme